MIKILLCGLKYDKNFGDSIINDCCKYIIKNEIFHGKEVIIKEVDLAGKRDFDEFYSMPKNFSYYFNLGIRKVLSVCNKILKKYTVKILLVLLK